MHGHSSTKTIFQLLGAFFLLCLVFPSVYQSICLSSCIKSPPAREIFIKLYVWQLLLCTVQEDRFCSKSDKNDRRLRRASLLIHLILRSILLKLTNFSGRCCRQYQNTLFKYIFTKLILSTR